MPSNKIVNRKKAYLVLPLKILKLQDYLRQIPAKVLFSPQSSSSQATLALAPFSSTLNQKKETRPHHHALRGFSGMNEIIYQRKLLKD